MTDLHCIPNIVIKILSLDSSLIASLPLLWIPTICLCLLCILNILFLSEKQFIVLYSSVHVHSCPLQCERAVWLPLWPPAQMAWSSPSLHPHLLPHRRAPWKGPCNSCDPSGPTADVISTSKQLNPAARRADVPHLVITKTGIHSHITSKMLSGVNCWEVESQIFQRSRWLEKWHGPAVLRKNFCTLSNEILKMGLKGTESINNFNSLLQEKIKSIGDISDVSVSPWLGSLWQRPPQVTWSGSCLPTEREISSYSEPPCWEVFLNTCPALCVLFVTTVQVFESLF